MSISRNAFLASFVVSTLAYTACSTSKHELKGTERAGHSADRFQNQEKNLAYPKHQQAGFRGVAQQGREDVVALMRGWVVDLNPDGGLITNAEDADTRNLKEGMAARKPYAGSYWPDRVGGVAARYREIDQQVAQLRSPKANYRSWKRKNDKLKKRYEKLTEEDIQVLSPAEKYDLLVGDKNFTFSQNVWDGILKQHEIQGGMAFWSGLCNGWTASSIELERPRRHVKAKNPDGKIITFYPDDLKALGSALWGHDFVYPTSTMDDGSPAMVMYGIRCNKRRPPRENNGSVANLDPNEYTTDSTECKDLNPGMWHLSVLNRLGVQKRAFIIDKDYNVTVNNHVVYGYKFKYFQPVTGQAGAYRHTRVALADYQDDPFKNRRHPLAKYVVGVEMEVKYIDYTLPTVGQTWDHETLDKVNSMTVKYDIETDEAGTVLSGNWRVNKKQKENILGSFPKPKYPDFMWYQRRWTYALAEQGNEPYLYDHDWSQPIPQVLRERAIQGAKQVYTYGLRERAELPILKNEDLKTKAKQASDEYDNACSKYCAKAYASDPAAYHSPEGVEARAKMAPFDANLTKYHQMLDTVGIPRDKHFVQPIARIVYGLYEAAKEHDPSPPPIPGVDPEEQDQ